MKDTKYQILPLKYRNLHNAILKVRVGTSAIATAGQTGQLTGGQTCGLKTGCDASACTTHTITCAPALASATHITVRMLDATNTFLMLDEVTWA